MNDQLKQFLVDYGHILLLFTNTQTIDDALSSMVSSCEKAESFEASYGVDAFILYWEWMLLPADHDTRIRITKIVKSKYNHHKLYEK